jgi:hypothetical protein
MPGSKIGWISDSFLQRLGSAAVTEDTRHAVSTSVVSYADGADAFHHPQDTRSR